MRVNVLGFITAFFFSLISPALAVSDNPAVLGMPRIGPAYGAPPRSYHDSKVVIITFKTSPDVLQKLVPKPMVPNKEGIITLYFGHFEAPAYDRGSFHFPGESYEETGLVAPVSLFKEGGGYSLFLYLNKVAPAISGREIWGFPKKDADIVMTEKEGKITFNVNRLGVPIVKATFKKTAKVENIPARPARARYNLKYIPSATKDGPPDVMQIVSYKQETKIKELYNGEASLELGSTPVDPLGEIPIAKIIKAEYLVVDGGVDYGGVLYDYLKERK
ncbi:acetoacetate decarboxylase family protein [Geomonas sp. Red32]|uniref:acetoacetate decarboxylase family protein n=1 Tax=Geomonas sp. Red32 TaxID=2912856 RepID=UPI00202CFD4B|nr:acetoacetate decarboxylase family protein [Geomonas sp. Red32]MCM0083165.1 acetoacetate decarboxylase family protein [Geomonas sp. Red32]